jgi:hypothetical protein
MRRPNPVVTPQSTYTCATAIHHQWEEEECVEERKRETRRGMESRGNDEGGFKGN